MAQLLCARRPTQAFLVHLVKVAQEGAVKVRVVVGAIMAGVGPVRVAVAAGPATVQRPGQCSSTISTQGTDMLLLTS